MSSQPCQKLARIIARQDKLSALYTPNGKQRDYIRRNNVLPLYWRQLSKGDESEILALLNSKAILRSSAIEIDACFAIACILSTGRKLEALLQLHAYPDDNSFKRSGRNFGLVASSNEMKWVLPIGTPQRSELRFEGATETELYDRAAGDFETFEWVAGDMVRRYWSLKNKSVPETGRALFSSNPDLLSSKIVNLLRSRRSQFLTEPRYASRTLEALERHLCATLTHEAGGDLASAARITDNTSYLSKTATYYGETVIDNPRILDEDLCEAEPQNGSTIEGLTGLVQSLGSAHTPSDAKLKDIIARLQRGVESASSTSDIFHQYYSRYTALLVSFGLGHRGESLQPLPSSKAIDPDTGFVAIHDTARTAKQSHTRTVWAADVIREQIGFYEDYLRKRTDSFPQDLTDYVTKSLSECTLPFFILEAGTWRPVSTPEIYQAIRNGRSASDTLKLNAGRHWLRSNMLGRCSEETINAFLGHWFLGREPWGYGSTLDPLRYRSDLERTLPELLRALGFKAVPYWVSFNDN